MWPGPQEEASWTPYFTGYQSERLTIAVEPEEKSLVVGRCENDVECDCITLKRKSFGLLDDRETKCVIKRVKKENTAVELRMKIKSFLIAQQWYKYIPLDSILANLISES